MASPHEKLAESLEALRAQQDRGVVAVRSGDLTRTHRERLVKKRLPAGSHEGLVHTLSSAGRGDW